MSQTIFKDSFIERLIDKASPSDAVVLRKLTAPGAGTGKGIKGGSVIDKIASRKKIENFDTISQSDMERSKLFIKNSASGKLAEEKRIDMTLNLFGIDPANISYRKKDQLKQKQSQLADIIAIANRTAKQSKAGDLITAIGRLASTIDKLNSTVAPSDKGFQDFTKRVKSGQRNNISGVLEQMLETGVESGQEWLSLENKDRGLRVRSEAVVDALDDRFQTPEPLEINEELFIGDETGSKSISSMTSMSEQGRPSSEQSQGQGLIPIMQRAEALQNPVAQNLFQRGSEFGNPDYSDSALSQAIPFGLGSMPESSFAHSVQGDDPRTVRSAPGGANFFPMGSSSSIPSVFPSVNAEASAASMGNNVQTQTKQASSDLMTAAQIARQNLLIKSNMLTAKQKKAQKAFKKKELTFEEMEAIKQARELEAFKLRVDEMSADFRNESMQAAQRHIDQQLNSNLMYGIPLVR